MTTCLFAPGTHHQGFTFLSHEQSAFVVERMLRKLGISATTADKLLALSLGQVNEYRKGRRRMGIAVYGRIGYLKDLADEYPDYWTSDRLVQEFDWATIADHPYGLPSGAVERHGHGGFKLRAAV